MTSHNGHNHHHHRQTGLKTAFFLNLAFTVFELAGGLYVNSVAVVSDAVHDFGDSISIGLAWYFDRVSKRKATRQFSFGYARFSLLGALINSVVLVAGSVYVVTEAVGRLLHPETSDARGMIFLAVVGVTVNGYAAWRVGSGKTMNERVISLHLLEDVLGWVAVLVAGGVLMVYETPYLDPVLSLLITAYILWGTAKRLRETLVVFLQGTPHEVDVQEIERKLSQLPLVASLHDSHIWSLDGERNVFSTHVKLRDIAGLGDMLAVKKRIKEILRPYHFANCTVEVELADEQCSMEEVNGK